MMEIQAIKIEKNGDWNYGEVVYKDDAIVQNIRVRLNEIKGTMFYALDEGVEFYNLPEMLDDEIVQMVGKVIASTVGVLSVKFIELERLSNTLKIAYQYSTIYSENLAFVANL